MYKRIKAGIAVQIISNKLACANFAGTGFFFSSNFHKTSARIIPTLTPIAIKIQNKKL
jgi:hypothetical protein